MPTEPQARLPHVLERVVLWWALLGGVGLLLIVGATAFNVGAFAADMVAQEFGRSIRAFPGYEDFVRLVVSAAVPMMFPYCQLRRGHVAVDLFVEQMPRPVQRAIDVISLIGMTVLVVFLLYWMVIGMMETRADHAISRVLAWPEWPFYLPGLISLALWALVAGFDAVRTLQGRSMSGQPGP